MLVKRLVHFHLLILMLRISLLKIVIAFKSIEFDVDADGKRLLSAFTDCLLSIKRAQIEETSFNRFDYHSCL